MRAYLILIFITTLLLVELMDRFNRQTAVFAASAQNSGFVPAEFTSIAFVGNLRQRHQFPLNSWYVQYACEHDVELTKFVFNLDVTNTNALALTTVNVATIGLSSV